MSLVQSIWSSRSERTTLSKLHKSKALMLKFHAYIL